MEIFNDIFKMHFGNIEYTVNETQGVVVAVVDFSIPYYYFLSDQDVEIRYRAIGIARVNREAGDIFDIEKGKKIARAKAEKAAFQQFKQAVVAYKNRVEKPYRLALDTIQKMNACIQHQEKYIKSF